METLTKIQNELKVPKGNLNKFGNYKYRSAEDILEAVKPLLSKHKATVVLTDEIVLVGSKIFLKATAVFTAGSDNFAVHGFAETSEHKGMSAEQTTGTASSYARKYALNGLFLIDETEADADSQAPEKKAAKPEVKEKPYLNESSPQFQEAVKFLQGTGTIEQIKAKYNLSAEVETNLLNAVLI